MLQRAKQVLNVAQKAGLASPHKLVEAVAPAAWASNETKSASWVFLGPPGVGKGTYSSRVADALGVPHISAGDLVRHEMRNRTEYGVKMESIVNSGRLLPDSLILELLHNRLAEGRARGEEGFLLDGFPRTRAQAAALVDFTEVQLAINLSLREEVLMAKCLGRRVCGKCNKNFNVADILIQPMGGRPAIQMPPLLPPEECEKYMETRQDDTVEVITKRLEVYSKEAAPVEDFFRERGVLLDFEITGGIPETLPRLIAALTPHTHLLAEQQAAEVA